MDEEAGGNNPDNVPSWRPAVLKLQESRTGGERYRMYRFKVGQNEKILHKGLASLHIEEATFSGALYLTNERLVFVGHMLGGNASTKEVSVPLGQIGSIRGVRTALIIPNGVEIVTKGNDRLRLILRNRKEWLTAIARQQAGAE
jgi:hypothetical protein